MHQHKNGELCVGSLEFESRPHDFSPLLERHNYFVVDFHVWTPDFSHFYPWICFLKKITTLPEQWLANVKGCSCKKPNFTRLLPHTLRGDSWPACKRSRPFIWGGRWILQAFVSSTWWTLIQDMCSSTEDFKGVKIFSHVKHEPI